MMGQSPLCYIPSVVEIGQLVPEKFFFKGFIIYGRGGHLGNVSQMARTNFRSPQNLDLICQAVSQKKMFDIVDGRRTYAGA